jgi:hypothetical protein
MPKLNANNIVTKKSTAPIKRDKLTSLGGIVDVKNIVVNETEVPPLI